MKFFLLLAVAALLCIAAASDEAVVTLTNANFDKWIADNKVALVEFYAPWCGHCKSLAPEYEAAAKKLLGKVPLAKVDATVERDLAERFDIRGYPSIKFFRAGKPEEYNGGRTEQTIVDWVESNTGPAVIEVSAADLEKMKKEKPVIFVATTSKTSALYTMFEKIADTNRDLGKFVLVDGDKSELTVVRKDEPVVTFKGTATDEALLKFIQEESFPLYGPINGDNYSKYQARNADLSWVVCSPEDSEKYAPVIREVAAKFRSTNSFVHLDTVQFASHAENSLGVSEYPAVVIQKKSGRFVYPEKEITASKLSSFLDDVLAGKMKRSLKSEPVPEKNDGPVKVVVGNNFEQMVINPNKDVFLEVYAPWCGHCKKLEPTWNELGEALADSDVLVAKMDGTANESPVDGFEWSGFPSLFFVKAGSKTPLKYNGGRTKDALLDYVKNQASKELKLGAGSASAGDEL